MAVVFLIVGMLVGALAVAFYARPRLHGLREQIERERTGAEERVALVQQLNANWEECFREMTSAALAQNNDSFLTLAETKLSPLPATLSKFEQQTQALETSRQDAYNRLSNQVVSLVSLQEQLRAETRSLSTALRAPATRGPWGARGARALGRDANGPDGRGGGNARVLRLRRAVVDPRRRRAAAPSRPR